MADRTKERKAKLETVEPLGKRVLIRKDQDKKVTKGGIELPDSIEIPTITGRVVAVSAHVEHDDDFNSVSCHHFNHSLANRLRELPVPRIRNALLWLYCSLPGKSDYMMMTPFVLHFGWLKYKNVFNDMAERLWDNAVTERSLEPDTPESSRSEIFPLEGQDRGTRR